MIPDRWEREGRKSKVKPITSTGTTDILLYWLFVYFKQSTGINRASTDSQSMTRPKIHQILWPFLTSLKSTSGHGQTDELEYIGRFRQQIFLSSKNELGHSKRRWLRWGYFLWCHKSFWIFTLSEIIKIIGKKVEEKIYYACNLWCV